MQESCPQEQNCMRMNHKKTLSSLCNFMETWRNPGFTFVILVFSASRLQVSCSASCFHFLLPTSHKKRVNESHLLLEWRCCDQQGVLEWSLSIHWFPTFFIPAFFPVHYIRLQHFGSAATLPLQIKNPSFSTSVADILHFSPRIIVSLMTHGFLS